MSFTSYSKRVQSFAGQLLCLASILVTLASQNTSATSVTVRELSTDPRKTVTIRVTGFYDSPDRDYYGGAYAGVVNMLVDGVLTEGFCIDPFHFSSRNPLQYEVINLDDAPKPHPNFPGDMGAEKAEKISKLWAMAYAPYADTLTGSAAAAIQIAIWEIVAGDKFTIVGNDHGAGALLNRLQNYQGPGAKLVALTGPGQDYVTAKVPDGGATAILLGLGVGALALVRRARC